MKGTLKVKRNGLRPRLVVTADGRGVVGRAGTRLLSDLADATGLSGALSEALAPLRRRASGHDPGRVAVDLATMLADGGEAIADLAVLEMTYAAAAPQRSPATKPPTSAAALSSASTTGPSRRAPLWRDPHHPRRVPPLATQAANIHPSNGPALATHRRCTPAGLSPRPV